MGFEQTTEGRVFFRNADNDDLPVETKKISPEATKPKPLTNNMSKPTPQPSPKKTSDSPITKNQTQMQILMLLKNLNGKLKESHDSQAAMKEELEHYKTALKAIEKKAENYEKNYIDLEQKVASKQNEIGKKTSRVSDSVKDVTKQIEDARTLVRKLEDKTTGREEALDVIKDAIDKQKTLVEEHGKEIASEKDLQKARAQALLKRQKSLEKIQKDQGQKMVNNVAAYVALTKRVSEAEARNEVLDNKLEETASEFLKLDRKIEKAMEDRNRILRKIERIENAVVETRDALNAKAMVLLTQQGAVAGVEFPKISEETLNSTPEELQQKLDAQNALPWWKKSVELNFYSLAMLVLIGLLIGWIIGEIRSPDYVTRIQPEISSGQAEATPKINFEVIPETTSPKADQRESLLDTPPTTKTASIDFATVKEDLPPPPQQIQIKTPQKDENISESNNVVSFTQEPDFGIKIHKGIKSTEELEYKENDIDAIDINNEEEMLAVLEKDPKALAERLNRIEPTRAPPPQEKIEPTPPVQIQKPTTNPLENSKSDYKISLKRRISPDPNLPEIAKKIENKAFDGVPEAQHDMGAIYVSGHGQIQQNLDRAILWFKEAASNGVANAKYNLGVLYHQGMGVDENLGEAMKLYGEAADMGHPEAAYNLGIANIEGIGVPYNPQKAARYFEGAANQGVTEAAYNLGLIYENGLLGQPQPDQALMWYQNAADQGSPEAKAALQQLADNLGIGLEDVSRIVDKLRAASPKPPPSSNDYQGLVSNIQKELMNRGLYPGPVDGVNGPMTENAIRSFQTAANLDVNGVPTQELLSYMRSSSGY
ncbi:MAG: peptidoglycan-binding protein [Alphaproteobacteria bacterium]|nr:peptidoglycan-binding protein [Alphaproteobacteria bacterium]